MLMVHINLKLCEIYSGIVDLIGEREHPPSSARPMTKGAPYYLIAGGSEEYLTAIIQTEIWRFASPYS